MVAVYSMREKSIFNIKNYLSVRGWPDVSIVRNRLAEDQSSIPSTHFRLLTAACNSSFRESDIFFWPPGAPTLMSHTNPTHIIVIKINVEKSPNYVFPEFNQSLNDDTI